MVAKPDLPARPALISRRWDFWLLGGASLVVWMLACLAWHGKRQPNANSFLTAVVTLTAVDLLVNHPHLLASYHLAYFRGRPFIMKHWFHTIFVPLALLFTLGWAFWLLARPSATPEGGALLLGGAVNFMFLVSGWHYTKQAFGVTMVYAAFDRYPLLRWQRELIRYSLLALWWYSFAGGPLGAGSIEGLSYSKWNALLPGWVAPLTGGLLVALLAGVLVGVFLRNWKQQRPSLNLVTPYAAIFLWFVPWLRPQAFFQIVPVFHGLQYLVFVYRVERFRKPGVFLRRAAGWSALVALIVFAYVLLQGVPGLLDGHGLHRAQFSFFVVAVGVFFNVHHIFLDNVLWRLGEDRDVRQALMT